MRPPALPESEVARSAATGLGSTPLTMKPSRLCALSVVLSLARAATVTNGSFEENTTEGGTTYQPLYAGFPGLPGWRFSSGPDPVLIGTPDDSYAYKTPFGRWQVDLSGSDNTTGGWLETDVTGLTPGADYRLDFALGVSTDWLSGGGPPSLKVLLGGSPTAFVAPPTQVIEWLPKTVEFRATAGLMTVRFENTSPLGTGFIAVDSVTVSELSLPPEISLVPQPDGRLRLDFRGTLESSADLSSWTPEPDLTTATLLTPDGAARFYRTKGN